MNIEVKVPLYTAGRYGPWTLATTCGETSGYGYITPFSLEPHELHTLSRDGDVWMSTCKLERESHMPHIIDAKGVVVVAGVGMGMYLRNIAGKPEVTEIHAYDISQDVIDLVKQATDLDQWDGHEKITLHHKDILDASRSDFPPIVNYLYADIWLDLGSEWAMEEVRRMQAVVGAQQVGWWGMELDYIDWRQAERLDFDAASYAKWVTFSRLPLVSRNQSDISYLRKAETTFARIAHFRSQAANPSCI